MQFKYRAITNTGQIVEGVHDASGENEVITMLKGSNFMPISIEQTSTSSGSRSISVKKVKKKDLAIFCRQFYTMLNSGVSIVKCLDILERQSENRILKNAIAEVYENVQKGMTLSEGMRSNDKVFPAILINMVESGEASGSLDVVMERMAIHYEKEFKIENKIRGAMIYPIVLAVIAIAVVIFMLVAVMPTFISMFESSGVPLPFPTRMLLGMSNSLKSHWYIYLFVIAGIVFIIKYTGNTPGGALFYDTVKLRLPVMKTTVVKICTSRFTRTLATLLQSGIPLIQGIDIVSRVIGNEYVAQKLADSKEEVRKGVPLSRTIRDTVVFPPMVDSMIKIGEESGALDDILNRCADFYDEEVEVAIQKMTELLQPIMIVIMAVIVGFIVISIALPMFDMMSTVQ